MHNNLATAAKISLAALTLTLSVGCASLKPDVDAAKSAAEEARQQAAQALQAAQAAQSTADQALQAAQQSQQCCNDTNEKIDRMFKKSMNK